MVDLDCMLVRDAIGGVYRGLQAGCQIESKGCVVAMNSVIVEQCSQLIDFNYQCIVLHYRVDTAIITLFSI